MKPSNGDIVSIALPNGTTYAVKPGAKVDRDTLVIGNKFGQLTVATATWSERHGKVVACTCACGGSAIVRVDALLAGLVERCRKRARHQAR